MESMTSEAKTAQMDKSGGGEVKPLPKPSKITKSDWQKVETFLKEDLEQRKLSDFRRNAERKWKEIDRQIAMLPMVKINRNGQEVDQGWHNVVELGELAKSSENVSADVRRIVFPNSKFWFEAHCDISDQMPLNKETGERKRDAKLEEKVNGRLRSLMNQQHEDFGLKDRVELSIKEALHHGSYVAEIEWDTQEMVFDAVKVKEKSSPIWVPYSMWNCYPDPSPSVVGTNMFYEGTMFVETYVPRYRAERMVKSGEDGWMPSQWKKVNKDIHKGKDEEKIKDVKLTKYWGDINIERGDETLYYPNHKVILMNGTIVYMAPNDTPYPPIIYKGYERTDVRDPYYTSPIIKQSPMQKLGSTMANKGMDGVELSLEPPIVYDGNDPDFVLNGGPIIEPGSKVPSKGSNAFTQIEIGNPQVAFDALQFILNEMKEKLGRPGRPVGDRATKAEVVKAAQDQEASLLGFIDKLEISLRSYLFMQHAMNLSRLKEYSYYSSEMTDPDFILVANKDLPRAVHFEVVGARGVLGEEERTQKMSIVTAFAAGNPLFAPLLDRSSILLQMYQDAGAKNPERFLVTEEGSVSDLKQKVQQLTQALQKVGAAYTQEKQKSQVKMAKIQSDHQTKMTKIMADHSDRVMKIKTEAALETHKMVNEVKLAVAELMHTMKHDMREFVAGRQDKAREHIENIVEKSTQKATQ